MRAILSPKKWLRGPGSREEIHAVEVASEPFGHKLGTDQHRLGHLGMMLKDLKRLMIPETLLMMCPEASADVFTYDEKYNYLIILKFKMHHLTPKIKMIHVYFRRTLLFIIYMTLIYFSVELSHTQSCEKLYLWLKTCIFYLLQCVWMCSCVHKYNKISLTVFLLYQHTVWCHVHKSQELFTCKTFIIMYYILLSIKFSKMLSELVLYFCSVS